MPQLSQKDCHGIFSSYPWRPVAASIEMGFWYLYPAAVICPGDRGLRLAMAGSMDIAEDLGARSRHQRQGYVINQSYKSNNSPLPYLLYPTIYHSEQKCAHFCSEWRIVGYGRGAFRELWIRSTISTENYGISLLSHVLYFSSDTHAQIQNQISQVWISCYIP